MSILEAGGDFSKPAGDKTLTAFDRQVFESLQKVLDIPGLFKEYMVQYMALNQPPVSIQSIIGFTQFVPQLAFRQGVGTITTSSYGDLSDGAGPSLTGLPDGNYLLLYGATAKSSLAAGNAVISVQDSDLNLAFMAGTDEATLFAATTVSLSSGGNNTVTLRYRTGATASTATFQYRRLLAWKISNL